MNYRDGACPRFGSCHFRLKEHVLQRATLVFGDSVSDPHDRGLINTFEPVLAGLLEEMKAHRNALGRKEVDVTTFVSALLHSGNTRERFLVYTMRSAYCRGAMRSVKMIPRAS